MAEPTLIEVFGAGATQTATHISIAKADLNITPTTANRAEQLFAGIVKKASTALTVSSLGSNPDQSISIETGFESIIYRTVGSTQASFLQTQLNLNFAKPQLSAGVTPDDY